MYRLLVISPLLCAVLAATSFAQLAVKEVVVQGASLNDEYGGGTTCGVDGQVYRRPSGGPLTSVMRVSPDGSTLLFTLPEHVFPDLIAPVGTGVNIMSTTYSPGEHRFHFQMFDFDSQANLLSQTEGTLPVRPTGMAALPSGRTIVIGTHSNDPYNQNEWEYGFAILDSKDKVVKSVDLPLPPGGGGWTFASPIAAGDGVAYVMLHDDNPPQTAIATIAEKGNKNLDINVIAAPPNFGTREHNQWVFGPAVAVEIYHYSDERPHITLRFDEYDLGSGGKIATRSGPGTGFQFGCYLGDEFSMLAHSAHVDPARRLSSETLRLVTARLQ